jgi:GntR family transcriptional regulator
MLLDTWLPQDLGRPLTAKALGKRAMYELLLDQGVKFGRVVQEITAQAADPERARLLETEVSAPLLQLTRLVHDKKARPIQHLTLHLSPERSRILMDIDSEAIDSLSVGHVAHS